MPKEFIVSKMKKFLGDKSHNIHMHECGVKPATYFSWLAGRRMPGKEFHPALEASFGVSIHLLFPNWVEEKAVKEEPPKACPFCRSPKHQKISGSESQFQTVCTQCGCSGPVAVDAIEANRKWNWRPKKIG